MGKLVEARRNSLKTIGRVVIVSGIIASTVVVATPAQAAAETYRNAYTRNCLDGDDTQAVYGHSCNGGNYQRWWISRAYGLIGFENKQTKRCLRDVGDDIRAPRRGWETCAAASSRQRWG